MSFNVFIKVIDWTKKKLEHHCLEKEIYFREKEVWWVALGKNIGFEVDGKHYLFERPVLILKKYSKDMCFILPLTSKIKPDNPWYQILINISGGISSINLSQGRTISRKRFLRKMGVMDKKEYEIVLRKFKEQFN